ncbi:MAG: helix-turn-helix domain-containing protein [Ginsengibacter sp.]
MKTETVSEFYERVAMPGMHEALPIEDKSGHFNVYRRDNQCGSKPTPYNRRDFYKISLVIGKGVLHYADKGIEINNTALKFSNPLIPYSWEPGSGNQSGFFCLFTEGFIGSGDKNESLQNSPLFKIGGNPICFLNKEQEKTASDIFTKMLSEINTNYTYKNDLLRNYVHLLLHEAMRLQPAETYFKHTNASARIAALFIELLERQFPIDSPEHGLHLKTAADYAAKLSVHVNHLNRAVKEVTGKTTTEHISEKITGEAKALLQHTDWNVSEIAYSLGFEYPAYFNNFFKKQTERTPSSFRR